MVLCDVGNISDRNRMNEDMCDYLLLFCRLGKLMYDLIFESALLKINIYLL